MTFSYPIYRSWPGLVRLSRTVKSNHDAADRLDESREIFVSGVSIPI